MRSCSNFDPIGSENSCSGGSLHDCPIAAGFISKHEEECLTVGQIALNDDDRLMATHAYFEGKKAAEGDNNANM